MQRAKKTFWVFLVSTMLLTSCRRNQTGPFPGDWPWHFQDVGASWSPGGEWIAYTHSGRTEEGDTSGVYIVRVDGTGNELIFPGVTNSVDWAPSGSKLLFDYTGAIWVVRSDGDSAVQIAADDGRQKSQPVWSPDGKKIGYCVPWGDSAGAWIMDSSGDHVSLVLRGPGAVDWFPDGERVVVGGFMHDYQNDLWFTGIGSVSVSGEEFTLILSAKSIDVLEDNIRPRVSPHGSNIAFHAQREGRATEVWVVDSGGDHPKELTSHGGRDPTWSPDGQRILYTDGRDGKLWVMRPDGSDQHSICTSWGQISKLDKQSRNRGTGVGSSFKNGRQSL